MRADEIEIRDSATNPYNCEVYRKSDGKLLFSMPRECAGIGDVDDESTRIAVSAAYSAGAVDGMQTGRATLQEELRDLLGCKP